MTDLQFWIPCNPPKKTYQSGSIIMRGRNGKPFMGKSKTGKDLMASLQSLFQPHAPAKPITGPVELSLKYAFPFRKTEKKAILAQGWNWNDKRPDADNLAKQVQDTLGLLRFYEDDGQIARLVVEKIWSDNPGIYVCIKELIAQ